MGVSDQISRMTPRITEPASMEARRSRERRCAGRPEVRAGLISAPRSPRACGSRRTQSVSAPGGPTSRLRLRAPAWRYRTRSGSRVSPELRWSPLAPARYQIDGREVADRPKGGEQRAEEIEVRQQREGDVQEAAGAGRSVNFGRVIDVLGYPHPRGEEDQ